MRCACLLLLLLIIFCVCAQLSQLTFDESLALWGSPRVPGRMALIGCRGPSPRNILLIIWLATAVVWRINLVRQAAHDDRVCLVHRSSVRWNKVRCVLLAFGHAFSSEIETMMGCPAIGIVAYARRRPHPVKETQCDVLERHGSSKTSHS